MKRAYISTKERAKHSTYAAENSADEYASDKFERGVDITVHEGIHQFGKEGRKGLETTKDNIHKSKDGLSDHTCIVQKVENGIVYTVEGNSGDSVRQKQYSVGYYEILGYGVPQY